MFGLVFKLPGAQSDSKSINQTYGIGFRNIKARPALNGVFQILFRIANFADVIK